MMNYILEFKELFEKCIKQENEIKIAILQGKQSFGSMFNYFINQKIIELDRYLNKVSQYVEDIKFREQIVELKKDNIKRETTHLKKRKKNEPNNIIILYKLTYYEKLLNVINWDWIKENFYECLCNSFSTIVSDWRVLLLDDLYEEYKRRINNQYEYSKDNPLSMFYANKGIYLKMEDNNGLFSVSEGFTLKANGLPKIYDEKNNTHIIIRYVPNDFVRFIIDLRTKERFDIAFRPDYNLCGDNIKDLCMILETVVRGKPFNMCISQLPKLSELKDYTGTNDCLIIKKDIKKDTQELTFEEVVDDFEVYDNSIVTQVVHLQYQTDADKEYITHIDHEYVFYNLSDYETKRNDSKLSNLTVKGESRRPFKTFKIDKAKIEFVSDANANIVVQSLKAFFRNDKLINEYFERLIQPPLKSDK